MKFAILSFMISLLMFNNCMVHENKSKKEPGFLGIPFRVASAKYVNQRIQKIYDSLEISPVFTFHGNQNNGILSGLSISGGDRYRGQCQNRADTIFVDFDGFFQTKSGRYILGYYRDFLDTATFKCRNDTLFFRSISGDSLVLFKSPEIKE